MPGVACLFVSAERGRESWRGHFVLHGADCPPAPVWFTGKMKMGEKRKENDQAQLNR